MATKQVKLLLSRSTPGTHVYVEEEPLAAKQTFPTIYLKKGHLPNPPPPAITVTIEYKEV
jgi:hypothetical protein